MSSVLIDTNVLIDVLAHDPEWADWSADALRRAGDEATLVINPIVFGELSFGYPTIEALDAALPARFVRREPIPYEAAFLAGRAFLLYRQRNGARRMILPDFFIGAHAAVAGYRLLTRDPGRYRAYFPRVELISPV